MAFLTPEQGEMAWAKHTFPSFKLLAFFKVMVHLTGKRYNSQLKMIALVKPQKEAVNQATLYFK